jgi:long-chain fatty acid transport protein
MKKVGMILCVFGLLLLAAAPLYAGGIINKQNQSADYMRTLGRHAATDYVDIAVYNPAGLMKMEDGAYAKLDVMYFAKDYSNTVTGYGKLDQDKASVIPGLFTVYKTDKWAGFFTFTIPAGGGELEYENGDYRTILLGNGVAGSINTLLPPALAYDRVSNMYLKVKESTVYGFTLGGSYELNDMWAVSAGVRYSSGTREFDGSVLISSSNPVPTVNDPIPLSLDLQQDADGWAGMLGVNFSPNDKLNVGSVFFTKTKMDYENKVKGEFPPGLAAQIGYPNGSKTRIDIPGLLGMGVSYKFTPEFLLALNGTYYFEKSASIDTFDNEGDSWEVGISGEYAFTPQWKASLGFLYTDIKLDDDQQYKEPEEPKLDAMTVAAGVVWTPAPAWALTFGGAYVNYDDVTSSAPVGPPISVKYEKSVWNLSIGCQWKFM